MTKTDVRSSAGEAQRGEARGSGSPRVLVVDDDATSREALRRHLVGRGLQVIAIGTGDQPMRILSREIDLLFVAVTLASAEALALLRYARASLPGLAILATTEVGEEQATAAASRAGADEVLSKSIGSDAISTRIDRLLARSPHAPAPALALGDEQKEEPAPQQNTFMGHAEPEALIARLRDPETEVYEGSFFVEYATKELLRSQRYGRPFGLATMRISEVGTLLQSHGAGVVRALLRSILRNVIRTARDVDVVARLDRDELAVILPETDHFGTLMFQRRVLAAVAEDPAMTAHAQLLPFSLEIGAATHSRDGKTLDELLARSRERAIQGRRSLARGLVALGFWESVGELLEGRVAALPEQGGEEGLSEGATPFYESRRLSMEPRLFQAIRAEAMREIARTPEGRGLFYVSAGSDALQAAVPMIEALTGGSPDWNIHLIGRRGPSFLHHPAITPVYVDAEDPMCSHDLLLFLSETTAYGLVRKAGAREDAFHSSDGPLISHLITRLQQAYDLHSY